MIIKCNDTRNTICDWLASLAITYDIQARLAERKTVQREMRIKSDTIAAAAKFIQEQELEQ